MSAPLRKDNRRSTSASGAVTGHLLTHSHEPRSSHEGSMIAGGTRPPSSALTPTANDGPLHVMSPSVLPSLVSTVAVPTAPYRRASTIQSQLLQPLSMQTRPSSYYRHVGNGNNSSTTTTPVGFSTATAPEECSSVSLKTFPNTTATAFPTSPALVPSSAQPSYLPTFLHGLTSHLRLSEGLSCVDYHSTFRALAIGSTRQIHVVEVIPVVGHDLAGQVSAKGHVGVPTSPVAPLPLASAPFVLRNTGVFGGMVKVEGITWYPSKEEASLAFIQPGRAITIFLDALQFKGDGTYLPQQWTRSQHKGKTLNASAAAGSGSTAVAVVSSHALPAGGGGATPMTCTTMSGSGIQTPASFPSHSGAAAATATVATGGGIGVGSSFCGPSGQSYTSSPHDNGFPSIPGGLPCVTRHPSGPLAKELIELNIDITYMRVEKIAWDPHRPYTLALTSTTTHFELWQVVTAGQHIYPPQLVLRPPAHNTRAVVRDIAFSPSDPHLILVMTESASTGQILLYDRRQVEVPRCVETAGPGLCAAFHPLFSDLLAVCYRKEKTRSDCRIAFFRVLSNDAGVLSTAVATGPSTVSAAAASAAAGGAAPAIPPTASAYPQLVAQDSLQHIDSFACISRLRWRPSSCGTLINPKRHHYTTFVPSADRLLRLCPRPTAPALPTTLDAQSHNNLRKDPQCAWADLLHSQLWFATTAVTADSDISVWDAVNSYFPVCGIKYLAKADIGKEATDFVWLNELTLVSIFKNGEAICTSFLNSMLEVKMNEEGRRLPTQVVVQKPPSQLQNPPQVPEALPNDDKDVDHPNDTEADHAAASAVVSRKVDDTAFLSSYQRDTLADFFSIYTILPTSSIVSDLFGHSFVIRNNSTSVRRFYTTLIRTECIALAHRLSNQVLQEAGLRKTWSQQRYQQPLLGHAGGSSSSGGGGVPAQQQPAQCSRRPPSPFALSFKAVGGGHATSSHGSSSSPQTPKQNVTVSRRYSAASATSSLGGHHLGRSSAGAAEVVPLPVVNVATLRAPRRDPGLSSGSPAPAAEEVAPIVIPSESPSAANSPMEALEAPSPDRSFAGWIAKALGFHRRERVSLYRSSQGSVTPSTTGGRSAAPLPPEPLTGTEALGSGCAPSICTASPKLAPGRLTYPVAGGHISSVASTLDPTSPISFSQVDGGSNSSSGSPHHSMPPVTRYGSGAIGFPASLGDHHDRPRSTAGGSTDENGGWRSSSQFAQLFPLLQQTADEAVVGDAMIAASPPVAISIPAELRQSSQTERSTSSGARRLMLLASPAATSAAAPFLPTSPLSLPLSQSVNAPSPPFSLLQQNSGSHQLYDVNHDAGIGAAAPPQPLSHMSRPRVPPHLSSPATAEEYLSRPHKISAAIEGLVLNDAVSGWAYTERHSEEGLFMKFALEWDMGYELALCMKRMRNDRRDAETAAAQHEQHPVRSTARPYAAALPPTRVPLKRMASPARLNGREQPSLIPSPEQVDDKVASMMEANSRICEQAEQLYLQQPQQSHLDTSDTLSTPREEDLNGVPCEQHPRHNGGRGVGAVSAKMPGRLRDPRSQWWCAAAHAWRSHQVSFIITLTIQQLEYASLMGDVQYALVLHILFCLWWRLRFEMMEEKADDGCDLGKAETTTEGVAPVAGVTQVDGREVGGRRTFDSAAGDREMAVELNPHLSSNKPLSRGSSVTDKEDLQSGAKIDNNGRNRKSTIPCPLMPIPADPLIADPAKVDDPLHLPESGGGKPMQCLDSDGSLNGKREGANSRHDGARLPIPGPSSSCSSSSNPYLCSTSVTPSPLPPPSSKGAAVHTTDWSGKKTAEEATAAANWALNDLGFHTCSPEMWKLRSQQWLEAYIAALYARQLHVPLNELLLIIPEIYREPCNPVQPRAADIAYEKQLTYVFCGHCTKSELWSRTPVERVSAAVRLYERVLDANRNVSEMDRKPNRCGNVGYTTAAVEPDDNVDDGGIGEVWDSYRSSHSSITTPSVESPRSGMDTDGDDGDYDEPSAKELPHPHISLSDTSSYDSSIADWGAEHGGSSVAMKNESSSGTDDGGAAPAGNGGQGETTTTAAEAVMSAQTKAERRRRRRHYQQSPPPTEVWLAAQSRFCTNGGGIEDAESVKEDMELSVPPRTAIYDGIHHEIATSPASNAVCRRCHSTTAMTCVICEEVVEGIFFWLRSCGHGGHVHHMEEWLRYASECPSCGVPITNTWKSS